MKIIGFAGKKQSGKNTAANFILMMKLIELGICKHARLNEQGELEVSDILGQTITNQNYFVFKSPYVNTRKFFENWGHHIKLYAFAYKLKEICMDVLGLTYDQCYGTDEDKNSITQIKWEDMPGMVTNRNHWKNLTSDETAKQYILFHKKGYMTAREVVQFVGTEIFRKIISTCWTDQLVNQIKKEQPELAIVTDIRFRNELTAIQEQGGFVIYLTRNSRSRDTHASETNIQPRFCDAVLDNSKLDIPEQNKQLFYLLQDNHITNFKMI